MVKLTLYIKVQSLVNYQNKTTISRNGIILLFRIPISFSKYVQFWVVSEAQEQQIGLRDHQTWHRWIARAYKWWLVFPTGWRTFALWSSCSCISQRDDSQSFKKEKRAIDWPATSPSSIAVWEKEWLTWSPDLSPLNYEIFQVTKYISNKKVHPIIIRLLYVLISMGCFPIVW